MKKNCAFYLEDTHLLKIFFWGSPTWSHLKMLKFYEDWGLLAPKRSFTWLYQRIIYTLWSVNPKMVLCGVTEGIFKTFWEECCSCVWRKFLYKSEKDELDFQSLLCKNSKVGIPFFPDLWSISLRYKILCNNLYFIKYVKVCINRYTSR